MAKATANPSGSSDEGIVIYPKDKYSTSSSSGSSGGGSSSIDMADLTLANQVRSILLALDMLTTRVNEMEDTNNIDAKIKKLYKRILGSNYAKYNNLTDISTKIDLTDADLTNIKGQIRQLFDLIGNSNYGLTAKVEENAQAISDLDDTVKYCKKFDPASARDDKVYMVDDEG